jgi:hypothetical protein
MRPQFGDAKNSLGQWNQKALRAETGFCLTAKLKALVEEDAGTEALK